MAAGPYAAQVASIPTRRLRALGVALLLVALVLPACSLLDDEDASSSADATTPSTDQPSTDQPSTGAPTTLDGTGGEADEPMPSDSTAPSSPGPAPELTWEDCLLAECATLTVPLDHEEPDGETIELGLARRSASGDPDERVGVILVNPGGPGGSGVDLLRSGFELPGDLGQRFDLVSWDPRGVGRSHAIECGGAELRTWLATDPDPDDETERAELEAAARALAEECARTDGDFLAHVSTLDAIEDMEAIRVALGEEQISYLGLSYGTFIGQLYLETHPDRLRSMVLDGVMDPALPLAELATSQADGFEAALTRLTVACGGAVDCAVDDPGAAYDELMARAEEEPIPAGNGRVVGPAELTTAAAFALYSPTMWELLTDAFAEALDGDARTLSLLALQYQQLGGFTSYAAVVCLDFGPPEDAAAFAALDEELSAEYPRFGGSLANELLPCAYWPVEPIRPPAPVASPDGAPPVLVVSNLGDPATPPAEARDVADRLDGTRLDFDGEGHLSLGESPCVDGAVVAYFDDLTLPEDGTVCE